MKIAVVTSDGITINGHFGRARYYLVITVENGQIINREQRDKTGAQPVVQADAIDIGDSQPSGNRHEQLIAPIADCDVVLSRGMGRGMYATLLAAGVRIFLTNVLMIDKAVAAYIEGRLEEHPELLHG